MTRQFHDVRKGTKGTDVFVLQAFLRSAMYTGKDGQPLEVDGEAGDNTVYAINTFKKLNRVYNVDGSTWEPNGVFDSVCWARLGVM